MAGLDLDKIIETSERLDQQMNRPPRQQGHAMRSSSVGSVSIDELDQITSRPIIAANMQETKTYNAKNEIEKINEVRASGGLSVENARNCGLPPAVLESIIKNPCMLDPTLAERNSPGSVMAERLRESGGPSGNNAFDKMKSLMVRQDEKDIREAEVASNRFNSKGTTQNVNEVTQPYAAAIDYGMIKMIIESVVKEQLQNVKESLLTESHVNTKNNSPLSFLRITEKGIHLVDSKDNVYECSLRYVGRRESKK